MHKELFLPKSLLLTGRTDNRQVEVRDLPICFCDADEMDFDMVQIIETKDDGQRSLTSITTVCKQENKISKRVQTTIINSDNEEKITEKIEEVSYVKGRMVHSIKVDEVIKTTVKKICRFEFESYKNSHPMLAYFEQYYDKVEQYYGRMLAFDSDQLKYEIVTHKENKLSRCNDVYQLKEETDIFGLVVEIKIDRGYPVALAMMNKSRTSFDTIITHMIQYEVSKEL